MVRLMLKSKTKAKKLSHIAIIIKEARKLGLHVQQHKEQRVQKVLISNANKMFVLTGDNFYPDVQRWLPKLFNDKVLTQKILRQKGYKTVSTQTFHPSDFVSKKKFLEHVRAVPVTFPVIIKPNDGMKGRDISLITNSKELIEACLHFYKSAKKILIQPVIWDDEYRITFIANAPVMVHKKSQPRVYGDGVSTLKQLLAAQPDTLKEPNFIKWNLRSNKLLLSSILSVGEEFETHIIKKRTPEYYVTEKLPPQVVKWGSALMQDFSCSTIAIDFTSKDDLQTPERFVIFELNACPGWTYVTSELGDAETPYKLANLILKSYFKLK